jgi:uncharacterized protein (TIGR00266 family)
MDVQIRHNPAFAVARVQLSGTEAVRADAGAMMATSHGVEVGGEMAGGLMKGLKRSVLGGESMFLSTFTAPGEGGWVDFAARLPGDAAAIPVDGAINVHRGSWICSSSGVEIDTKWGGLKNVAAGEGAFLVRAQGSGTIVVSSYGAMDVLDLTAGERMVIDSGHMVAFGDGVDFTTRKSAKGFMQTLKSGEGLVMEFVGPGRLWVQSRNPHELTEWLTDVLPFEPRGAGR